MKKFTITCLVAIFTIIGCKATHIRGGEIYVKRISGLTCEITLIGFAKISSTVKFGGGELNLGDGSPVVITPQASSNEGYDLSYDPTTGIYRYVIQHTYANSGYYVVSYFERNFDQGIINFNNSVDTPFYIESGFILDPQQAEFANMTFSTAPIFRFTVGNEVVISMASTDTTNRIYGYELIEPNQAAGVPVDGYIFPENLQLNAQSGLLTWDTKFQGQSIAGEYAFALKVYQYTKDGKYLGFTTRVFEFIVEDGISKFGLSNPVNDPIGRVLVEPGNQKAIKLILSDTLVADTVYWNLYFPSTISDNITFDQYDSITDSRKIKVAKFNFNSTQEIERDLPYPVLLRGFSYRDDPFSLLAQDVSFLLFTKDIELPIIPSVITSTGKQSALQVFPNPCTTEITVKGLNDGAAVSLFDQTGRFISDRPTDGNGKINVSPLASGFYILRVKDSGGQKAFKILKK